MTKLASSNTSKLLAAVTQKAKGILNIAYVSRSKLLSIVQYGKLKFVYTVKYFFDAYSKTIPETISFTSLKQAFFSKTLTDSYSVADTISIGSNKPLVHITNLQDQLDFANTFDREFIEFGLANDYNENLVIKVAQDQLQVTDSRTIVNQFFRDVNSTISFTDDVNGAALDDDQNVTYWKVLTNSFNIGESLASTVYYYREFTDGGLLADSIENIVINKVLIDTVNFTDDINGAALDDDQNVTYWKVLANSTIISDNLTSDLQFYRNFEDYYNISDSLISDYVKQQTDQTNFEDTKVLGVFKNFTDGYLLSDTIENVVAFNRAPSDTSNISDTINLFNIGKNIANTFTISESIFIALDRFLFLQSNITLTDDVNGAAVDDDQSVVYFKNTTNIFSVAESDIKGIVKAVANSFNIASSGLIVTQNYVNSPTYFAEGYVGSETNI